MRALPTHAAPALMLSACILTLGACTDERDGSATDGNNGNIDISPIDLATFPADPNTKDRVIYMSLQEAAQRMGSLKFEAKSNFEFNRGGQQLEQNDLYAITQDSHGNYHVLLDTPESQIEIFLVGETVHVRHDKGHLRQKPRRDIESGNWCELAFSCVSQALELFSPQLSITDPSLDETTPRQTMRYNLTLDENNAIVLQRPPSRATSPVAPKARWRELARPLDLRGNLWVDTATGVISRLSLDGRIEVSDRQVRPTQLKIHFESTITDVGKVAAVRPGDSIPEVSRHRRPRDPLSFFRDQLPKLEDPEEEDNPSQ